MTLTFFKQDELIAENTLMSVPQGEERLKLANQAVYSYFDWLVDNLNNHIKVVIGGWRRGYTAKSVADYLVYEKYGRVSDASYDVKEVGSLTHSMFSKMGYGIETDTWGFQYGYKPSLEERSEDPLEMQVAINNRAKDIAKLTNSEYVPFGAYQNNTGSVRGEAEINAIKRFRMEVTSALKVRQDQFFTVTQEDIHA